LPAGHPAVQLAAVVGKPDPLRTEIVKAYVVLRPGYAASARLPRRSEIGSRRGCRCTNIRARSNFSTSLPLTTSGKVIRRILRDRAIAEG
jgi:acetyl-CoA synthetase